MNSAALLRVSSITAAGLRHDGQMCTWCTRLFSRLYYHCAFVLSYQARAHMQRMRAEQIRPQQTMNPWNTIIRQEAIPRPYPTAESKHAQGGHGSCVEVTGTSSAAAGREQSSMPSGLRGSRGCARGRSPTGATSRSRYSASPTCAPLHCGSATGTAAPMSKPPAAHAVPTSENTRDDYMAQLALWLAMKRGAAKLLYDSFMGDLADRLVHPFLAHTSASKVEIVGDNFI